MRASIMPPFQPLLTPLVVALPLLASLGSIAFSTTQAKAQTRSSGDIVDTAVDADQLNTLATALQAAGLVDPLKGPGPFIVFAPTDAAFAKLPAGTDSAADVSMLQQATTVEGEDVMIDAANGMVRETTPR